MREKLEILEKEKRKISDENSTLKGELKRLQDLLASHCRIPREEPPEQKVFACRMKKRSGVPMCRELYPLDFKVEYNET